MLKKLWNLYKEAVVLSHYGENNNGSYFKF